MLNWKTTERVGEAAGQCLLQLERRGEAKTCGKAGGLWAWLKTNPETSAGLDR